MERDMPEVMTDIDRQECFAAYFNGIVSEYPHAVQAAGAAAVRLRDGGTVMAGHMQLAVGYLQDSFESGLWFGNDNHQTSVEDALTVGLEAYGFSGLPIERAFLHRPLLLLGKTISDARVAMTPSRNRLRTLEPHQRDRLQLNALLAARSLEAGNSVTNYKIRVLQRRLAQ